MITVRSFVVLGLSLIVGLAIFGLQIGRAVKTGREFDRFLSVRGLSEREMKANLAIWPIHFSVSAEQLDALRSEMESKRTLVLGYLKDSGIEVKEITQGLPEVTDREDERLEKKTREMARYLGMMTLAVRSTNVDIVKKAIQGADALLQKGVTLASDSGAGRPDFSFTALNDVKPDMIREATANARAAAEKFAQDSHSRVGRIRRATQGEFEITDRDAASPEWKMLRVVTTVDFFLE